MQQEQLFVLLLAAAAALLGLAVALPFVTRSRQLRDRLKEGQPRPEPNARTGRANMVNAVHRVGEATGKVFEPGSAEEKSDLRRRLSHAGYYSASALHLMAGVRAIALAAGLVGGYMAGVSFGSPLAGLIFGLLLGYYLPWLWLKNRIHAQQRALEHGLPDALDLMVVCVEAGLTLDAAMQRVSREVALAHPILARELAITHMETEMGVPHSQAVRNFARRSGCGAVQSFAAMLVQAERFGTGIAQSLRIHAEGLRVKRQHLAEERAAKASIKMTFPLVLCIFPAMLIVLGAPAFIRMAQSNLFGK